MNIRNNIKMYSKIVLFKKDKGFARHIYFLRKGDNYVKKNKTYDSVNLLI